MKNQLRISEENNTYIVHPIITQVTPTFEGAYLLHLGAAEGKGHRIFKITPEVLGNIINLLELPEITYGAHHEDLVSISEIISKKIYDINGHLKLMTKDSNLIGFEVISKDDVEE